MILTLLLVSTWPFWFFLIAFLGCELFVIEKNEDPWLVTVSTLGFLAFILLFTDWKPWQSITIGEFILYGSAYLIIGAVYALFPRWAAFVKDKSIEFETRYDSLSADWNSENKSKWHADWKFEKYKDFDDMLRKNYQFPPMPWDKGVRKILYMHMIYWIPSAIWLICGKTARYVFDIALAIAKDKMATISYAISKSHFKGK